MLHFDITYNFSINLTFDVWFFLVTKGVQYMRKFFFFTFDQILSMLTLLPAWWQDKQGRQLST